MADCAPTGSLEVFIRESILLPNGNEEVATNTKKISGVNQLVRRLDTISANWEGSKLYEYLGLPRFENLNKIFLIFSFKILTSTNYPLLIL